jgi:oligopeptide/dipeptide ABC transporter ATP-binding protein
MSPVLLDIAGLEVRFFTDDGVVKAVDGVDLSIERGETLALVGESGSGKSVTALAVMALVPSPGRVTAGRIAFEDSDLLRMSERQMQSLRGNDIGMVFQEPMTALNPVKRIGDHIIEVLRLHTRLPRDEAARRGEEMLARVGIPDAARRMSDYPHQLSGGMRQRVMIAMALACEPKLIIADEPTTALDVTIQAQILALMNDLRRDFQASILLITHDLGVVAETADRVAVMYAGRIVEQAGVEDLFDRPCHPYTKGLLDSIPRLDQEVPADRMLTAIPGVVPSPLNLPPGCSFANRCPRAEHQCSLTMPGLSETAPGHLVRCSNLG